MIKNVWKNEDGISLVELISAVSIMSVVMALIGGILSNVHYISTEQRQQVEFQQISNSIAARLENISNIDNIYSKAGYLGKFKPSDDGKMWEEQNIIKVVDGTKDEKPVIELVDQGANEIGITDILDDSNNHLRYYQVKDKDYKIKIIQRKNKNEESRTHFGMPNYRDTFTIQTSVFILFYKGEISFPAANFCTDEEIEAIRKNKKIKYSREVELTYRDEEKSRGEVPGDGRW